jgi:hypothetical protein
MASGVAVAGEVLGLLAQPTSVAPTRAKAAVRAAREVRDRDSMVFFLGIVVYGKA